MKKSRLWFLAFTPLLVFSCGSVPEVDSSSSASDSPEFEEGSSLLFSKFYLGSGYRDRVVQIANYGDASVDLSSCSIRIFSGTKTAPSYSIPLGQGSLEPMKTLSIGFNEMEDEVPCDFKTADLMENGSWPMGLYRGETRVDTLGEIGYTNPFASDEVIVRKNEYRVGREKSERYDWIGYPRSYSKNFSDPVCPISEEELLRGPKLTEEQLTLPYMDESGKGTGGSVEVTVQSYGDGDTTRFNYPDSLSEFAGHSFRYQNIDTPETQHGNTIQEQPWGEAAAKWNNARLKEAKHIRIQSVEKGTLMEGYGRLLGFVWVTDKENPTASDYVNLNYWTILEGYSRFAFEASVSYMKYGEISYNSYFTDVNARGVKTGIRVFGEKDPNFSYPNA